MPAADLHRGVERIPEDPSLAAFADRFLVRVFVEPIVDSRLEDLLEGGWGLGKGAVEQRATLEHVDFLAAAAKAADTRAVRESLAHAVRLLRRGGVELSDRRIVKVQRLVAAAGVLAGRESPTTADLWPILFAVPTQDGQRMARDLLRDVLEASQSQTLTAAAEAASSSPASRAARLAESAALLLGAAPAGEDGAALEHWRLKLEGVAREIDSTFDAAQLPEVLAPVRARIVETLTPK